MTTAKDFFHDLFRNKTFIITFLAFMIIIAIILGEEYGNNDTSVHCYDAHSGIERECPVGMGGTPVLTNETTPFIEHMKNWSNPS